jgi:LAO/AO transport system kinase
MHPLSQGVLAHQKRAIASLMKALEAREEQAYTCLHELAAHTGKAHIVGITGPPGSGKSTITGRLITHLRRRGQRVGVIAVDPSSPFTKGAILGDRIRMQQHAGDPDVFIRSLASRGALGGLSHAAAGFARILDAAGYDIILLETIGVGQAELDVMFHADTILIVTPPGQGDHIQAIKAGLLEIGHVYVLNKADQPGVQHTRRALKQMLHLRRHTSPDPDWQPPVIPTIATQDKGMDELLEAIDKHKSQPLSQERQAVRLQQETHALLRSMLEDDLGQFVHAHNTLSTTQTPSHNSDPFITARTLFRAYKSQ